MIRGKKMKKEYDVRKNKGINDYILLSLGVMLTAVAIVFLFTPNRLAAGGAQGIALVINHFTGLNIGLIMVAINLTLFMAAFFILGKGFGQKTLFSSLGLSLTVFILERYFYVRPITENPMLAAVFGSALMGLGVGIILNRNASIGGTSLLGKIVSKYSFFNQVSCIVMIDLLVTLFAMVVFGVEIGLYQLISVYLTGEVVNKVIDGISYRREVMIITEHKEEIMKYIMVDMKKGVTVLKGKGGYTDKDTDIILSILTSREFIKLKIFIRSIDPKAFISVNMVTEVSGFGSVSS